MSVEADVVTYLAAAGLGLTAGTNLFEGEMPELPDTCVAVAHYASETSDDYAMGASLTAPGYEVELFQVMTRHATRATAISTAAAVHAALDNLGPATLSGRTYFRIESQGPPFSLAQDPSLRWRRAANYRAQKARG